MLAAALRFSLLVELLVYGLTASRYLGLPAEQAALAAICTLLGVRAGFIATTYLFAVAHHSPAPRLGACRAAAMAAAEYLAFLRLFLLIQPFERLWMGADRLEKGRPVLVLVHGYGCNRGAWWWLRRAFERAGYAVATLNLEPVYTGIDDYVALLDARIEAACGETGCARVTLIGHSMGGLVVRAYLAARGESRVAQAVTIASPHAGSALARIGLGRNARQMEPGSAWLKVLWQQRLHTPFVTLRNSHDNFVMPQDNQRLPGATDIELPGLGHLAVLFSRKAAAELLGVLATRT